MDSDKFISCTIKMFLVYGVWRSLVARTAGGREVAGSNPVIPIFTGDMWSLQDVWECMF